MSFQVYLRGKKEETDEPQHIYMSHTAELD